MSVRGFWKEFRRVVVPVQVALEERLAEAEKRTESPYCICGEIHGKGTGVMGTDPPVPELESVARCSQGGEDA